MIKLKEEIEKGKKAEFQIRDDGMIVKGQRMCVPEYDELKRDIMEEAHSSAYAMHPGSTKMYKTLKEHYWWNGMKKEIASFVSRCLTCQQVKAEHQKPAGKIQLFPIPVWKWEKITMDFVTGLPRTQRQHDAIWVIVDRLTKSAHFLPINIEVFSFIWNLVYSFRGRNVLKEGGFVTPRPDEVYSTCNCKGAYVHQVPL